jgi:hypothetical protein
VNTAAGVVIGLAASAISAIAAFWWKSTRDLKTSAAQCYDRLIKLREAQRLPDDEREEVLKHEINHLGPHMDLYLASLSAALLTWSRRPYWDAYEGMVPVLIRKDFSRLEHAIDRLRPLVRDAVRGEE